MIKQLVRGGTLALLAIVVSTAAPALAAQSTSFSGRTAQKYPVRLRLRGDKLQILHFKAELACRDGSALVDDESGFVPTPTHRGGKFSEVQEGSTDVVTIQGKVTGGAVRGRLRVKDRLQGGVRCDSHWVRFTAKH